MSESTADWQARTIVRKNKKERQLKTRNGKKVWLRFLPERRQIEQERVRVRDRERKREKKRSPSRRYVKKMR